MRYQYERTCTVSNTKTKKSVEAVVAHFAPEIELSVVLEQTAKINLKYNGLAYTGKFGGMDFTSPGPQYQTIKNGRSR